MPSNFPLARSSVPDMLPSQLVFFLWWVGRDHSAWLTWIYIAGWCDWWWIYVVGFNIIQHKSIINHRFMSVVLNDPYRPSTLYSFTWGWYLGPPLFYMGLSNFDERPVPHRPPQTPTTTWSISLSTWIEGALLGRSPSKRYPSHAKGLWFGMVQREGLHASSPSSLANQAAYARIMVWY